MKRLIIFRMIIVFFYVFLTSCAPQIKNLRPTGDIVKAVFQNGSELNGELLMVSDSCAYILDQNGIHSVNYNQLESITVKGYSNSNWISGIVAFELIPSALMGIAASSADADGGQVFLTLSIPTLLNTLIFATSTPPNPKMKHPISETDILNFKKYARFPQGLTPEQLAKF